MKTSDSIRTRSRASIADFTAWALFALLLLAVALPAAAQTAPKVDLELTKTVDKQFAAPGEDVIYTITVANKAVYGVDTKATNIFVKDYLPQGLTALAFSATTGGENGIAFDFPTLTWKIEWLKAGQSVDLQFKARVNKTGEFKNCAEVWDADQKDVDSRTGAEAGGQLLGLWKGEDDEDCAEFWGVATGSISGMVFEDKDEDGKFNGEPGLPGFEVDLNEIGADHMCGTKDDKEIAFTDTDAQGNYNFWDVSPGTYCLEIDDIQIPAGFQRTTANPIKVEVGAGQDVTGVKFGFIRPRIDLELTKVVDNENPTVGDKITFTITVKNNELGPYNQLVSTPTATGIQIVDYLPSELSFVKANTPFNTSFNASTLTWTINQLEAGKSVSLVLEATVSKDGELTNCAEVWDAHQHDRDSVDGARAGGKLVGGADAEDDQDCASLWARPRLIDLELTKVIDNPFPTVGDKVTFTLTLKNNDEHGTVPTATATGIQVKDYLPHGLTFAAANEPAGTSFDQGTTTWHISQLEAGKSISLVIEALASKAGEFTNCAEVWDDNEIDRDSQTGAEAGGNLIGDEDDQDCAALWVAPRTIDLELTKVVDNAFPQVGDVVKFTLKLTNNNAGGTAPTATATGVQVKDYLPAGLSLAKAHAPSGTTFDLASTTWHIDQLGAGKSLSLVLEAAVNQAGEFTNCAEVWDDNEVDRDSKTGAEAGGKLIGDEDDQDCASLWATAAQVDLELTKSISNANLKVGDSAEFTLVLKNNNSTGTSVKATNVIVKDYLPAGFWLQSGSSPQASSHGITFNQSDASFHVEWLKPGDAVTLLIKGRVDQKGEFTNCAEVWDSDQTDLDSRSGAVAGGKLVGDEDDQDCVDYWVGPAAPPPADKVDLELTKAVDNATPKVNDTITFTLTLTNNNVENGKTVPTAKATNVIVKDYLSAGFWLQSGSSPQASSHGITFDQSDASFHVEWLNPGDTVTLLIKGRVDQKGEFKNCTEVWDSDQTDRDSRSGAVAGGKLLGNEDDQDCVDYWVGGGTPPPTGKGNVTGIVFNDKDLDGILDSGEPGLFGFEVDLTTLGKDQKCGTSDDVELATIDTDSNGAYSFWDVDAGLYCVRILTAAIPQGFTPTSPLAVKVTVTAGGTAKANFGFKSKHTPPPPPPTSGNLCYLVADNDNTGTNSADVLATLAPGASQDVKVGGTWTDLIEAVAFNPWSGKLFATDGGELGTINLASGEFTSFGRIGGGEGEEGWIDFLDVDGLSFNPFNGELWGSVRRTGKRDYLIKIDPVSGKAVKNAFGPGIDYIVIKPENAFFGKELDDIDDLAWDPETGDLYAINNHDGTNSRLVILNPTSTGAWITKVLDLPLENVEGLAFFNNGTLYGTAGEGTEKVVRIDKRTLSVTIEANLGAAGRDYEAIDCLTAKPSNLAVAIPAGGQVDLYRDLDQDGVLTAVDILVATRQADANGVAHFSVAATGSFLAEVQSGAPIAATINGYGMSLEASASDATSTSTEGTEDLPGAFNLAGNYPNPFNPQTTVRFDMAESGQVRLSVHDVLGREIAVLVDGVVSAGQHKVTFEAGDLPSGTYLARLSGEFGVQTRAMVLLK